MNAGEIGDRAGRIFTYNIPINWIFRSQEDQNDFGIDAEIELKDSNGKALGKESVFKVQLKGELKTTTIKKGKYISYSLPTTRLKYYLSFKVPVIFIIVDVTSEHIFWYSLTDKKELYESIDNNSNQTIQLHIPTKNRLKANNRTSFDNLLNSVNSCWNHLSIRGLKQAVDNYHSLNQDEVKDVITNVGDALYKAYHQQLQLFLEQNNFDDLFRTAKQIIASELVPHKDRFVASLYFDHAFTKQPFTNILREVHEQKFRICTGLLYFAKKDKLLNHRLIAISKCRVALFRNANEQLFTLHILGKQPMSDGIGKYVLFTTSDTLYRECCKQLEKIIRLFDRMINLGQFHILTSALTTLIIPIILFQKVHKKRGATQSIKFFDDWFNDIYHLCLKYCLICGEELLALDLYRLNTECNESHRTKNRALILDSFKSSKETLDEIDANRPNLSETASLSSVSIEQQKEYYVSLAKSLHMDPNDPECTLGKVVHMAMKNYDPTKIVKNCEHLFVDYRPGGVVAEMLKLHSAGGMHLIYCSKHKYIAGTGNVLYNRYNCDSEHDFMKGFKQNHCDHCADKQPRSEDWIWSLDWQLRSSNLHKDFLKKIKF
ncbi:TPA: DUF4365 domain-containing protein [Enterobacter kobei]|nr:DUF4365 domain-containing protein [Enterobacter kobei]HBO0700554.1 DUF4365 domain-containing protein [Enterobacter kobei]HBO1175448.1 DUF4365 domain-containing protein [Enterobacter kobei]HBO1180151.1 DUF4365 domain-containing protein [Enterobacter kobei]HBO2006915.1 DUF4365 domain-containing protein [Enterobacter kobei]